MNYRKLSKAKKTVAIKEKKQDLSEVYRQLRTNIEFSSFNNKMQAISITSSLSNEGKTNTAINLAIVCAAKYDNVLLIDCDLRKPKVHRYFNISNSKGLSNWVMEKEINENDQKYFHKIKKDEMKNPLHILPAGVKVPSPQELLSSDKFAELVAKLKEKFDIIIFDCPPILPVSDVVPVAHLSDGTIFVVSSKDTNKKSAKLAVTTLQRNGANVIGTVLTKVESRNEAYYGYY